jgi:hypothetical protein
MVSSRHSLTDFSVNAHSIHNDVNMKKTVEDFEGSFLEPWGAYAEKVIPCKLRLRSFFLPLNFSM